MLDGNCFPQESSVMETEGLWTNRHVSLRNMSLVLFLLPLFLVVGFFYNILIAPGFLVNWSFISPTLKWNEDLLSWLFFYFFEEKTNITAFIMRHSNHIPTKVNPVHDDLKKLGIHFVIYNSYYSFEYITEEKINSFYQLTLFWISWEIFLNTLHHKTVTASCSPSTIVAFWCLLKADD